MRTKCSYPTCSNAVIHLAEGGWHLRPELHEKSLAEHGWLLWRAAEDRKHYLCPTHAHCARAMDEFLERYTERGPEPPAHPAQSHANRHGGFVRPIRNSYTHSGAKPRYPLHDLTPTQQAQYAGYGFVKFEEYPEGALDSGRFWTLKQLAGACGATTTMDDKMAESYARDPSAAIEAYCGGCRQHLPVDEFTWTQDGEVLGS